MTALFLKLLNMSIASSWLVLAVLMLRFFLRNAPKKVHYLLWAVVALRLLLPFTLESSFSLIPSAEVVPQDIAVSQELAIHSGIPAVNSAVNPLFTTYLSRDGWTLDGIISIFSNVWMIGMIGMLLYGMLSWLYLRRQVRVSAPMGNRSYLCDNVSSPFILGVFRPRIYMPSGIDEEHLPYVLAHETVHIRRKDHWWKPFGFLLLSVYWFNPLLWVAYILLCRDIEQSCDQKVISQMDNADRRRYIEALVACAAHRRTVMVCPVAFGELGVKTRVKAIVNYKKPGFWIVLVSLVVCIVTAVCFLTNPKSCNHTYESQITTAPTCTQTGVETFTCTLCRHSYSKRVSVLTHTFEAGTVLKAPTCTETGTQEYVCTHCGVQKTESLEIVPHTNGQIICAKKPNCTETGILSTSCAVCQTSYVVKTLNSNGVHDLHESVLVAPTCTTAGTGIRECSRCGHSESCTYAITEHNYKQGITIPGACIISAVVYNVCRDCGHEAYIPNNEFGEHVWCHLFNGVYYRQVQYCLVCSAVRDCPHEGNYMDYHYYTSR